MKILIVKYNGECRKCGAILSVGQNAAYEKITGIFCPACFPTDTEEVRKYRVERAEAKASRLEGWAAKRRERANAVFKSHEWARGDHAFNTQPGHIPLRARINAQDRRAWESLAVAKKLQSRADSLRRVRVKGDAAKACEQRAQAVLNWLRVGMSVNCGFAEPAEVVKINSKTATVKGQCGTYRQPLYLIFSEEGKNAQ